MDSRRITCDQGMLRRCVSQRRCRSVQMDAIVERSAQQKPFLSEIIESLNHLLPRSSEMAPVDGVALGLQVCLQFSPERWEHTPHMR